jgi:GT2 family glycosyltransferase
LKLSFVIVTVSNNFYLENLLNSIKEQKINNFEVIIVSNNKLSFKKFYKFKNLVTTEENPGEKRNLGAKKAIGDYLVFIDDDTTLPRNYTYNIGKLIKKNKKVFGGPGLIPKDESIKNKVLNLFLTNKIINPLSYRYNFSKSKIVKEMPSSNFVINKLLFKKVNGFNKNIWPGEDTDICYRINKYEKIHYCPNIYNFHYRRSTIIKLLRQFFRYGFYRYKVDKINLEIKNVLPAIFSLVTSCIFINSIYSQNIKLLLILSIIFIISINLIIIKDIKKNKCNILMPISTFLIIYTYGFGILFSMFKKTNVKYFR